jgi:hypothetical protein
MKQYKHIFDWLVNGEHVQIKAYDGQWCDNEPTAVLACIQTGWSPACFRVAPKTININGHEVPEPVREPLCSGDKYYLVDVTYELDFCDELTPWEWDGDEADKRWLSCGLIHLTKEAAEAHAKALLSFTKIKECSND